LGFRIWGKAKAGLEKAKRDSRLRGNDILAKSGRVFDPPFINRRKNAGQIRDQRITIDGDAGGEDDAAATEVCFWAVGRSAGGGRFNGGIDGRQAGKAVGGDIDGGRRAVESDHSGGACIAVYGGYDAGRDFGDYPGFFRGSREICGAFPALFRSDERDGKSVFDGELPGNRLAYSLSGGDAVKYSQLLDMEYREALEFMILTLDAEDRRKCKVGNRE